MPIARLRRAYFGYRVVAALFIAEIAVTGVSFYSFSLFLTAWQDDAAYERARDALTAKFIDNFRKFDVAAAIVDAGPRL